MRLAPTGTKVELPKYQLNTGVAFSFNEGKRIDTYSLNEASPKDIYSHEFASNISLSLFKGKRVLINCGEYTNERKTIDLFHPSKLKNPSKTEFIVSELIYGELAEKIRHMDDKSPDKKREIESSIRYETPINGLSNFIKQFIGYELPPFLFIELKENKNKIIGNKPSFDFLDEQDSVFKG